MIKISVDAVVLHLMVDDKVTLALKLSDVDFPIYDEAFPLVKAGKKFRLTLEEVESQSDGSSKLPSPECLESQSYTIPDHVAEMYMNSVKVIDYNTFYPDPEIEAHRKHIQEVIMPETKKVEGMITGTAGEVSEAVNKVPFCDGCKHIGVNPESGPCAVCFEGMMYESDKEVTMENTAVVNPDEKPSSLIETAKEMSSVTAAEAKYAERKKICGICGKCANSSNPSVCVRCIDYSRFEPSRYR